ncbi:hypothetical protein BST97_05800 [Nonlabens spongiae]|uniref:SAM-dependent methyltransferase n=1 Tax=Nonlabens spongiae TaxID=331648 RepID=A0A1W6MIU6_9FLAO|nr:class I SAM-dependent methyltransferase [Nonlabens spongiae]ARN77538.1 hypothetical protein BST97_05800 [Nonlabens spongiae]
MNLVIDYDKFFEVNKQTWNSKTPVHAGSMFYDGDAFAKAALSGVKGARNSLNSYELNAFPNVKGKSLLHLQYHFGQDSLSWAAGGAEVTGVDIIDVAINKENELSASLNIPADFVCCNVLETLQNVLEQFDIIFTSYGVIGWLPDLKPRQK